MPSCSMNRRDKSIFKKILKYCGDTLHAHQYFHEDKALFFNEEEGRIYRAAAAMDILQIGELAKSLAPEARRAHLDIPWAGIIKMREIFAHHYGDLNYDIVWDTLVNHVPALAERVRRILEEETLND